MLKAIRILPTDLKLAKLTVSITNEKQYKNKIINNKVLHVDGYNCSFLPTTPNLETVFIDCDKNFMYYNLQHFMSCKFIYVGAPFPLYNAELYNVLLNTIKSKRDLPYIFISEFGYGSKGMPHVIRNLLAEPRIGKSELQLLFSRVSPIRSYEFESSLSSYRVEPLNMT